MLSLKGLYQLPARGHDKSTNWVTFGAIQVLSPTASTLATLAVLQAPEAARGVLTAAVTAAAEPASAQQILPQAPLSFADRPGVWDSTGRVQLKNLTYAELEEWCESIGMWQLAGCRVTCTQPVAPTSQHHQCLSTWDATVLLTLMVQGPGSSSHCMRLLLQHQLYIAISSSSPPVGMFGGCHTLAIIHTAVELGPAGYVQQGQQLHVLFNCRL